MRIVALALTAAIALTALQAASAQTRVQPLQVTPPAPTLQKKAPVPAKPSPARALQKKAPTPTPQPQDLAPYKPDLVVVSHMKAGPAKVLLRVENHGAGPAPASTVWIRNEENLGAHSYQVGMIPPGHGKWVEAAVWPQVQQGDLFIVEADFTKKVVETNEKNNKYRFTW